MQMEGQMKKYVMAGLAGVAAIALMGPATAADMRVPAVVQPAPAFTWTGCYIGIHGGGGVLKSDFIDDTDWGGGGLAGGQIGCNYQMTWLVVGVEAEGWWSSLKSRDRFSDQIFSFSEFAKNRWDFDVALRVGAAFGNGLLYGKAGVVWGRFDYHREDTNPTNVNASVTMPGLLLGLGLEYAFSSNWTGKIEYNYLNYVETDARFTGTSSFTESVAAEKHIIKVGLNYLFGARAPLVARY